MSEETEDLTPKEELEQLKKYIAFFEDKLALACKRGKGQCFRRGRGNFLKRLYVARHREKKLEQLLESGGYRI